MKKFSSLQNLGIGVSDRLDPVDYAKLVAIADELQTISSVAELFLGGSSGQVLTKLSDTPGDFAWVGPEGLRGSAGL